MHCVLAVLSFGHSLFWGTTFPSQALYGDVKDIGRYGGFHYNSEAPEHLIAPAPEKMKSPSIFLSHEGEHHCESQSIKHCEVLRNHND